MRPSQSLPYLRHDLRILPVEDPHRFSVVTRESTVLGNLLTDSDATVFIEKLIPLADGTKTLDEIADCGVRSGLTRDDVIDGFKTLYDKGLVTDLSPTNGKPITQSLLPLLRSWSRHVSRPADLLIHLQSKAVAVAGDGDLGSYVLLGLAGNGVRTCFWLVCDAMANDSAWGASETRERLSALGCQVQHAKVSDILSPSKLTAKVQLIILVGRLQGDLLTLHDAAVTRNILVLCMDMIDQNGFLGPLVFPGRTACLRCRQFADVAHFSADTPPEPLTAIPAFSKATSELAAGFAVEALVFPDSHPLSNRIVMWDPFNLSQSNRRLLRDPECPLCSRRSRHPENSAVSGTVGLPNDSHL